MLPAARFIRCFEHQLSPVYSIAVRHFHPKSHPMCDPTYRGEIPPRFGHEPHHQTRGLLPRLKIKEKRLRSMPLTCKEDAWSPRQARMGENDYIRILSDTDMEQHELLTHIPDWLRGYSNMGREYSVLMRKRKEFNYWKYSKPIKWQHLEQRIRYLYRRINNKHAPPGIELLEKSRY